MAKEDRKYKRRFAMTDFLLTTDQTLGIEDPLTMWLLVYLYISPNNRDGYVRESLEEIARATRIPYEKLPDLFAVLQSTGRVFHKAIETVLVDWREYMGGQMQKDDSGFVKLTKHMVRKLKLERKTMDNEVFRAYVESCGHDNSDTLYAILDAPDNRGGDRKSEEYKAISKDDQKMINEGERDIDREVEVEGEREAIGPPSSSSKNNPSSILSKVVFRRQLIQALTHVHGWSCSGSKAKANLDKLCDKFYEWPFDRKPNQEYGQSVCAYVATVSKWYSELDCWDDPIHLGNLTSDHFNEYFEEQSDGLHFESEGSYLKWEIFPDSKPKNKQIDTQKEIDDDDAEWEDDDIPEGEEDDDGSDVSNEAFYRGGKKPELKPTIDNPDEKGGFYDENSQYITPDPDYDPRIDG